MEKRMIPEHVSDVVIIGGGPAGLTAGIYAARAGLRAVLIEGASTTSQITVTDMIENYPGMPEGIGGFDLVERFKQQAARFGLETTTGDVERITEKQWDGTRGWEVATSSGTYKSLTVIIATGAYWRRLEVPGEDAFIGKGVSYCATCDGPLYRNRDVVVVGGGDAAIQEAVFLTKFARKVTVVHRRDRLRAAKILQKQAFANPRIEFAWSSVVEEIIGTDFIEGVRIRDAKEPREKRVIPVEGVFIFAGLIPNTGFLRGIVELDESGYIRTTNGMETTAAGVFACGDCIIKRFRQVVTACGDGATAALSAQLYIEAVKGESYL